MRLFHIPFHVLTVRMSGMGGVSSSSSSSSRSTRSSRRAAAAVPAGAVDATPEQIVRASTIAPINVSEEWLWSVGKGCHENRKMGCSGDGHQRELRAT